MKYYTIFLGKEMWVSVIDDMNAGLSIWSEGGMLWTSKKKAEACIRNLKTYDFEKVNKKFIVVEMSKK